LPASSSAAGEQQVVGCKFKKIISDTEQKSNAARDICNAPKNNIFPPDGGKGVSLARLTSTAGRKRACVLPVTATKGDW